MFPAWETILISASATARFAGGFGIELDAQLGGENNVHHSDDRRMFQKVTGLPKKYDKSSIRLGH